MKKATQVVIAGRAKHWTQGLVNPPVSRASTVVFDSMAHMQEAVAKRHEHMLYYGRRGTNTHFAFQDALCSLDGAAGCALYPCGTAAITGALQAFLSAGDHLLMVDTAYEPTREFCKQILKRQGVETTYYDPLIGGDIAQYIRSNTRIIFLESPGSLTMEVQNVAAIVAVAKQHDIITMLDNTWASPLLFDAFGIGVDVVIHAATKYIVGHSDVMLGTASANARHWPVLREQSYLLGHCASPDDVYLATRGLRTLNVRLKQHEDNAMKVAHFLTNHEAVDHVRHPAFTSCPGHQYFMRDFSGSSGLFSFVTKHQSPQALSAMLDHMQYFKMGFSWGGFESLILAVSNVQRLRSATQWQHEGCLIRVHIGLENVDDLINDLAEGLARFTAAL